MFRRLARINERFRLDERVEPAAARRRLYVVAVVLVIVGLAGFLLVLRDVLELDGAAVFDDPVEEWANAGRSDFWTSVMTALSLVFGPLVFPWAASVVIIVWIISAKQLWRPLLLAVGTAVPIAAVRLIAELVGRERPPLNRMLMEPDYSESFPSGHVVGAASFILLFSYLAYSRRKSPRSTAISFVVASGLVVATGLSRIYLGYHWATDTIAAVMLALVILGVVIAIDTRRIVRTEEEVRGSGSRGAASGRIGDVPR